MAQVIGEDMPLDYLAHQASQHDELQQHHAQDQSARKRREHTSTAGQYSTTATTAS